MKIDFKGRVAIVTGSGNGLGRSHALALARRGAKVVVNDLPKGHDKVSDTANEVVDLIKAEGGEAIANGANVTNFDQVQQMVADAMAQWGRVDILVNNAGILRDKSFAKMSMEDFRLVIDVHLMGSVNCTKAVWDIMREQEYGRIVMTSSSSGLYGNFGQSNYGAAKMAVIGFMNTLVLEGHNKNIRVNALAPSAATQMTEGLIPEQVFGLMTTESVSAGLMALCHKDAPNRTILCAGAGGYAATHIYETEGLYLAPAEQTPEMVMALLDEIRDEIGQKELTTGAQQTEKFLHKAMISLKGSGQEI